MLLTQNRYLPMTSTILQMMATFPLNNREINEEALYQCQKILTTLVQFIQ